MKLKSLLFGLTFSVAAFYYQPETQAQDIGTAVKEATLLRSRGEVRQALTNLSGAFPLDLLQHSNALVGLVRTNKDYYEAAKLLGSLKAQAGEKKEALQVYQQVLEAKQALKLDDGDIYNRIGWAAYLNGDLPTSKKYLQTAVATKEKMDRDTKIKAQNNLGLVHFSLGEIDAAERVFTESKVKYDDSFSDTALHQLQNYRWQATNANKFIEAVGK